MRGRGEGACDFDNAFPFGDVREYDDEEPVQYCELEYCCCCCCCCVCACVAALDE